MLSCILGVSMGSQFRVYWSHLPIGGGLDINPHGSGLWWDHQSLAGSADKPGMGNVALAPLAKLGSGFEGKTPRSFASRAVGVQWEKWERVFPQASSDNPLKGNECLAPLPSSGRKYMDNCRCYCHGERGAEAGGKRDMFHCCCSKQQTNKH